MVLTPSSEGQMKLTGILLAAGESRRLGQDKRRLPLPNGSTLLLHCASLLHSATNNVVVVLKPKDDDLADALRKTGCQVCYNPKPSRGMGTSLSCGVTASGDSDGWLVQPADLPLIKPSTLQQIGAQLEHADAVVPFCHGRRGHPVGFGRCFRNRLLQLSGDHGGRHLLKDTDKNVEWLNLHDPGIYRDIDNATDIAAIERYMRV